MWTFKTRGLDEYTAKLDRIQTELPAEMERLMIESVLYTQNRIPPYPAPRGDYRRTGTLGRVITAFPGQTGGGGGENGGTPLTRVETMGGDVKGVIGARLEYIPYVIDSKHQARMHQGRWYTLQQVLDDAKAGIKRIFSNGVVKLFK